MNTKNPFADLSVDSDGEVERSIKPTSIPNSILILNGAMEKKRKRKIRPEEKKKIEEDKMLKEKTKEKPKEELKQNDKLENVKKNEIIEVIVENVDDVNRYGNHNLI